MSRPDSKVSLILEGNEREIESQRIQTILRWIGENADQIDRPPAVSIEINCKGSSVKPAIKIFYST